MHSADDKVTLMLSFVNKLALYTYERIENYITNLSGYLDQRLFELYRVPLTKLNTFTTKNVYCVSSELYSITKRLIVRTKSFFLINGTRILCAN